MAAPADHMIILAGMDSEFKVHENGPAGHRSKVNHLKKPSLTLTQKNAPQKSNFRDSKSPFESKNVETIVCFPFLCFEQSSGHYTFRPFQAVPAGRALLPPGFPNFRPMTRDAAGFAIRLSAVMA